MNNNSNNSNNSININIITINNQPLQRAVCSMLMVVVLVMLMALLAACTEPISSPHPNHAANQNTLYTALTGRSPKTLDPTSSYSSDEATFTYAIYEPPVTYHYLKRPYELIAGSTQLPTVQWFDAKGQLTMHAQDAATSVYTLHVKPNQRFQPHPALARASDGTLLYHHLSAIDLAHYDSPWDFPQMGTRPLTAFDFAYSIKRLATPRVPSPVFGHLLEYIVGLKELAIQLKAADAALTQGLPATQLDKPFLDLRRYDLAGVKVLDEQTLTITLKGVYPQFKYWLAMTFFAPIPWEVEAFYSQSGMAAHNLSLTHWPIGTGAYLLRSSIANRQHVLSRNPNYHGGTYPCEGDAGDKAQGLLADCGKPTPLIDTVVFDLEREAVPLQSKFLSGFYDMPDTQRGDYGSGYLVAIQDATQTGNLLKERHIQLPSHVDSSSSYLGFNWLDPVVGQGTDSTSQAQHRALRQAIAIAFDIEESVALFDADQAHVLHSPIPPGLFGYRAGQAGMNHTVYDWSEASQRPQRKPLSAAKQLMVAAGYPEGRDAKTGQPLVLYLDTMSGSGAKAQYEWEQRQLAKLGIQLEIRGTDYNRFQDKMRKGAAQLFEWGWNADYPDAENFLFLLYSANSKAKADGENASNYSNPQFDALFTQMKSLEDGTAKQALIDQMVALIQADVPWLWGRAPLSAGAYHQWVHNAKPSSQIRNALQYYRLDPALRAAKQREWNTAHWGALCFGAVILLLVLWGLRQVWRRYQASTL